MPVTPRCRAATRKFGAVYAESGAESAKLAGLFKDTLAGKGVQLAEQIPYTIDPARLQEQGAAMIGRLKAAGVTTVFFTGDPIAPRTFTEEATRQEYFPEWVINGSILTDVAAFGRTYDQQSAGHVFGITGGCGARPRGRGRTGLEAARVVLRQPAGGEGNGGHVVVRWCSSW